MINIKYGKAYSDDTWEYIVTTDCKRVGDFINEWLDNYPKEWGKIRILLPDVDYFDCPACEYQYGVIILNPFMKEDLDRSIVSVSGSGGWSCSDFNIRVK